MVISHDHGQRGRHPESFLIRCAKDPQANASLIGFTIWSSLVHGGIMPVQAPVDETERANLPGDIPALFLEAFVLWYLVPGRVHAWLEHLHTMRPERTASPLPGRSLYFLTRNPGSPLHVI